MCVYVLVCIYGGRTPTTSVLSIKLGYSFFMTSALTTFKKIMFIIFVCGGGVVYMYVVKII